MTSETLEPTPPRQGSVVPSSEVHSARSVVLFSTFLKAERNVRFNSLALAPSISASTTYSSAFPTEPFAASWSRACWIVWASERLMRALSVGFIWVEPSSPFFWDAVL